MAHKISVRGSSRDRGEPCGVQRAAVPGGGSVFWPVSEGCGCCVCVPVSVVPLSVSVLCPGPVPGWRSTTRSAFPAATCRECVMMTIVAPSLWSFRRIERMCSRAWVSRPTVGSSSTMISGLLASTPAMAASRRSPPERSHGERCLRCSIPTSFSISSTRLSASSEGSPRHAGPYAISSATVSANSWFSGCCMTYPMCERTFIRFLRAKASIPSIATLPDWGFSRAHISMARVDFPVPFSPHKATNSPLRMLSDSPFMISVLLPAYL